MESSQAVVPVDAAAAAGAPPANFAAGGSVSTSLYVGDLTPEISEGQLFEFFTRHRNVQSIRVCRDAVTRRSLGYAYVNFYSSNDAQFCLNQLNNLPIVEGGRPCRIMWSQRNPTLRKTGVGNVFINNLDKSIDLKALHETFSDFGTILSCKVALDDKGVRKGYGFVHYETQGEADKAISEVDGKRLGDFQQVVRVARFIPARERLEMSIKNFTNVYVNNISKDAKFEDIEAFFSKYGKIKRGVMKLHERTQKNFALLDFETHESAQSAVAETNGAEFLGEKIYVARAQSRTERLRELKQQFSLKPGRPGRSTNLYFKNIDDVDEAVLKAEFESCGRILSFHIRRNERQISLGFGFCSYETPEEAAAAINKLNAKQIGKKPLYVNYFQTHEERLRWLTEIKKRPPPIHNMNQSYPPNRMMPFQAQFQPPYPGAQYPPHMPPFMPQRMPPSPFPRPAPTLPGGVPLTADNLRKYPPEQQFVFVSQRLYPHIMKVRPDLAPKITGMLRAWYLESRPGPEALVRLMEDRSALDAKIAEAIQIWEEHVKQGQH